MKLTKLIVASLIVGSVYATEQPATTSEPEVKVENVKGDPFAGITLTKDQKKEITKLMKAERKEVKKLMKKLLKTDKADKNKHLKIREDIKEYKDSTIESIKALLTTEQLKVYEKNQEEIEKDLPKLEETP